MRLIAGILAGLALLAACVHGPAPAQRIEEASYIPIGGIEQWVTIRGDDDRTTVLLLLHGGPGDVQSPFVSVYAPYERDFVLVQWDQRGAGRTFAKNGAADLTLEKQIADGIELAQHLRARFPDQKLAVLGHSWGSVIATGMALQRPDLFDAYVGTGQAAAWGDTVQAQFDFLKARYLEMGDAAALARLEAIGKPDPLNIGQYFGFSRPLRQNMHASDTAWFAGLKEIAAANGEAEADIKTASDGMNASGAALIQSVIRTDLPATAPELKLPYCVIQGRHDLNAPTELAEAYFAIMKAPRKNMTVIEDAGHFALATHAGEFVETMKRCPGL